MAKKRKKKRQRSATSRRKSDAHVIQRAELRPVVVHRTVKQRIVSYRAYFDGELHAETPHVGGGGRLQATIANVTPGVKITTRVHSVDNFGLISDGAEAVGSAPFQDE